jgi:hypothetical protein
MRPTGKLQLASLSGAGHGSSKFPENMEARNLFGRGLDSGCWILKVSDQNIEGGRLSNVSDLNDDPLACPACPALFKTNSMRTLTASHRSSNPPSRLYLEGQNWSEIRYCRFH